MKKELTADHFVNKWLQGYHNTSIEAVLEAHPEWKEGDHSREFYATYPVTQEQHDEWYKWAIKKAAKSKGISKKAAKRVFSFAYLNTAPSVKK